MSVGYTGIVVIPVVNCDVLKYLNNDKNCYMLIKKLSKRAFTKYLLHIGKLWSITNEG